MTCTIYKDIYSDEPHYITVMQALERIKNGTSREKVEAIRAATDKAVSDNIKRQLPSVCFSGKFKKRKDAEIIEHSGVLVLDFDNLSDISVSSAEIASKSFIYALWTSPSGNGLKALVKIADTKKHREHFEAIKDIFPDVDKSGVNESRVCYESYDPKMYINENADVFTKYTTHEQFKATEAVNDTNKTFSNLLKWLNNKGSTFSSGERNNYIFKLAGGCCRYGINEQEAEMLIRNECPCTNDFTSRELGLTVKSAYRKNSSSFATAQFENEILVDKKTRREIKVEDYEIDPNEPPRDIIFGVDVRNNALDIFRNGYAKISGIGVPAIDNLWKSKKGELTVLTGIGNYGKSSWQKWYKLMRVLLYGEKFVTFSPEDNPPEEYYHDFVEMVLGQNCTPFDFEGNPNLDRPNEITYKNAYDFISDHIFYMSPKDESPTLEYILARFLEMIMKKKVSGCTIDPWNQVSHDYAGFGANTAKYLEYSLGKVSRFAITNDVYIDLVVHPKMMVKDGTGNYPCPDVFDINDGAMWNNKADNILVYHRPVKQTEPKVPICEFHSKKIKRQKTVGKCGEVQITYMAAKRRYEINGGDPMQDVINRNQLDFHDKITNYKPVTKVVEQTRPDNPRAGFQRPQPPVNWND